MKIAIPAKGINRFHKTGISWYLYHLLHHLAKVDNKNIYTFFSFKSRRHARESEELKQFLPRQDNFRTNVRRLNSHLSRKFTGSFLPVEFLIGMNDIMHLPCCQPLIVTARAKIVVTVHDLIPILPETTCLFPDEGLPKTRKLFTLCILESDRIIAVSEHTKNDIVRHFSVAPSKITVVHLAADGIFRLYDNDNKLKGILNKYGISGRYLIYTGNNNPRKNFVRLAQGFQNAVKHVPECRLVIAGPDYPVHESFDSLFSTLPPQVRSKVIITGYVPQEDMPYLYGGASALVYPSLYEGFGLPILEAMACGCPVVTSNVSSMPEVAGDAAILVNPYSVAEISAALEQVLCDEKLRARMSEKGLKRAKLFSWEKTAAETLGIYSDVCGRRNSLPFLRDIN